tara:strand:+ start:2430 stop:3095 length:666 start_codon:yes stop_codon:yes gene_type:complete
MNKSLNKLQDLIKIKFKNSDLLKNSITHKSYDKKNNYEKLEFIGDRVLGLSISKRLLDLYPDEKEGILDKKLASLVNKNKCYEVGKSLKLEKFILVGNSKKKNSVIENKIISDCCEALIGAIYIEKGFDFADKFIIKIWEIFLKDSNIIFIDPKTRLQEYSLKKFKYLPIYKLISNTGPRHKPNFKVAVRLKDTKNIYANGTSIKNAEQAAAKKFLENLKL